MRNFPDLESAVQWNCDVSDARHAGDYGMCTFLLKMREYFRWENELPYAAQLPKEELGEWLALREARWQAIENEPLRALPLQCGETDPLHADAANRELLSEGLVYSAGYGQSGKPVFFLGRLLRAERREGCTILVSSCEYARELAAPPAMLRGRTIYVRQESVRRYLWEKIEEWRWRKQGQAMARALSGYDFIGDTEGALARMADDEMETMILHELGEAKAGELLGEDWDELVSSMTHPRAERAVRAVRDLLADCLSTLPALIERANGPALHFYFATFDAPRRELFPQAREAYERFRAGGDPEALSQVVHEGRQHWLATARGLLALDRAGREAAVLGLVDEASARTGVH